MEENKIYHVTVMMQSGKYYKFKLDTSEELNHACNCLMTGTYQFQEGNKIVYIKSNFVESIEIFMEENNKENIK